jgi:hypothetical protein
MDGSSNRDKRRINAIRIDSRLIGAEQWKQSHNNFRTPKFFEYLEGSHALLRGWLTLSQLSAGLPPRPRHLRAKQDGPATDQTLTLASLPQHKNATSP